MKKLWGIIVTAAVSGSLLFFAASQDMAQTTTNQKGAQPQVVVDSDLLKEYEGRFEFNPTRFPNFTVDVEAKDNSLTLRLSHRQTREFLFAARDSFVDSESDKIHLTFNRNKNGRINGLTMHNLRMTYYFDDQSNVTSRMVAGGADADARKLELPPPSITGNTAFKLKGYENAKIIALAGSFNNWNQSETLFYKEGEEWVCRINLEPGKYFYKFIVDGSWITDPENSVTEPDEYGNVNSVLTTREK